MLEDTPAHAIFILATTEPQKMIPTIISRCQRFDFRKISVSEITERLKGIVKKEGASVEKEVLSLIASASGGSLRDGEGILSQILSFVPANSTVKKEDVKGLLGIIEREIIGDFIGFLLEDKAVEALGVLEKSFLQGITPEGFYENVIYYLREMMLLKIISEREGDSSTKSLMDSILTKLTQEEVERIKEQIKKLSTEEISEMIESFFEAGKRIKYSPIPQLPLEVAVAEVSEKLRKDEK